MIAAALALSAVIALPTPKPLRPPVNFRYDVYVGDAGHPVVAGLIWLFRFSWNGAARSNIGEIREGMATIAFEPDDIPRLEHPRKLADDHYIIAFELPGSQWYLSRPVDSHRFFADLPAAIETLGAAADGEPGAAGAIGLAPSTVRTISFVNDDGTPAGGVRAGVYVHVSRANHCAVEEGPDLGVHVADNRGMFSIASSPVPLFLDVQYYVDRGGSFAQESGIVVGRASEIRVRRTWSLPEQIVTLTLEGSDGRPAARRAIEAQIRSDSCANGADVVGTTDSRGNARLALVPLVLERLWVDQPGGHRRTLTPAEQRQLLRRGSLTIRV